MSVQTSARDADHATTPAACLNCGTILAGPWCHGCGQRGGPNHRSVLHLGAELVETLTHADSRLWRTLRRLVLRPAGLTADYLDGRRASEIPPLRLFFVMLFLVFGIGSLTSGPIGLHLDSADQKRAEQKLQNLTILQGSRATVWLRTHLERSLDDPAEVLSVMRDWSERFTLLLLPIAAFMLWVLYLPQRRFGLYDHMIFAIHSLCFACLALIAFFLAETIIGSAAGWLLLLPPLHLFVHMRGLYRSSVPGTLLRMLLLGVGSLIALVWIVLALAAIGLALGTHA